MTAALETTSHDKATRHEGQSGKGSGNGLGIGADGDPAPTLTIGDKHAVAVNISNGEPRVSDVVGTLDAAGESRGSSQQRFVMQSAFRKSKRAQTANDDGTGRGTPVVAFNWQNGGGYGNANEGLGIPHDGIGPLQRCQTPAVATRMVVRRLTPVECERLQGFPDDYTNIPWRGKPESPDGLRYKALGNSMAVNCMRWIGRRIDAVENGTELPA